MPTKKSSKSPPKKTKKPAATVNKQNTGTSIRAAVSYVTIVGWLIAYFVLQPENQDYDRFHLRQSLGLHICIMVCDVFAFMLFFLLPFLWIAYIVTLVVFAFKAKNGKKELVPYFGQKFQEWFVSL